MHVDIFQFLHSYQDKLITILLYGTGIANVQF